METRNTYQNLESLNLDVVNIITFKTSLVKETQKIPYIDPYNNRKIMIEEPLNYSLNKKSLRDNKYFL